MTAQELEAIRRLEENLQFERRTALAYVRAKGLCEYCGRELVFERLGYACAQIDHLLPRAKYSEEITGMEQNFALSCSLCNGIKRDDPLLEPSEDPEYMLTNERSELIRRARALIVRELQRPNEHWNQTKQIFKELGLDREEKNAR
jgi:HNH endonuclease